MSDSEQDLIRWKTDAWKDRGMVSWYSDRMVEDSGPIKLKNVIETELCERFLQGKTVLDVGIGTGRGSLPLIRKGYELTGTDSSQAMLDECKRLAGDAPIELMVGDVQALPFDDERFDNLVSLNVVTHFPHVERVLQEWKRVVKPNGRMVFDIYSLDHLSYARGRNVTIDELMARGASTFNMHVSRESLRAIANRVGLKIVATVPYGSFLGGEYRHPAFSTTLQASNWWTRQLSWLAVDDALLDMAVFLEREWFGCLSGIMTNRFMVVLENTAGEEQNNQTWFEQDLQLGNYLAQSRVQLDDLAPWLSLTPEVWREQFDRHLDRMRNRSMAYYLMTGFFLGRGDAFDWNDLAPRNGALMQQWAQAEDMDRGVQSLTRTWHQNQSLAELGRVNGVDLGDTLVYSLQKNIVQQLSQKDNGN